jgi:hypothetical protein
MEAAVPPMAVSRNSSSRTYDNFKGRKKGLKKLFRRSETAMFERMPFLKIGKIHELFARNYVEREMNCRGKRIDFRGWRMD